MTHAYTPANDNTRPAEFDARLVAYTPGIRKLAARYVPSQYRDDLAAETVMYSLENWRTFREGGAFYSWIKWNMWSIVRKQAQAAMRRKGMVLVPQEEESHDSTVEAAQEHHADLSAVLGHLTGTRNGRVVLRRAMGDKLDEIANDLGVTRTRVEQIAREERARLRRAVG